MWRPLQDAVSAHSFGKFPDEHTDPMKRSILIGALMLALAGAAAFLWWRQQPSLPPGIVSGNGRIEADTIDVETKFAGRIAVLMANEGDLVKGGQVLARMDTRDMEASLGKAQAEVEAAQNALAQAHAQVDQRRSELTLAQVEFERYRILLQQGNTTRQLFDQRNQVLRAAQAAVSESLAHAAEAENTLDAARHAADTITIDIADNTLVAPRDARIQYRLANIGEVLPAGGKVFSMLDLTEVYMNIYLPTDSAGKIHIGSPARIVLDAYPDIAVPAIVSFIASEAQFTPKAVETKAERDKLMFRVKLRIDPKLLREHAAEVRTGLPGLGYVQLDSNLPWPASLQSTLH
jgi:HlyD family secretion protein